MKTAEEITEELYRRWKLNAAKSKELGDQHTFVAYILSDMLDWIEGGELTVVVEDYR